MVDVIILWKLDYGNATMQAGLIPTNLFACSPCLTPAQLIVALRHSATPQTLFPVFDGYVLLS